MVVTEDGIIIACPLHNFFITMKLVKKTELQNKDYELYEKMDGSLGIMFHFENILIFCTHGSFVSDQAVKCKDIIKSK